VAVTFFRVARVFAPRRAGAAYPVELSVYCYSFGRYVMNLTVAQNHKID